MVVALVVDIRIVLCSLNIITRVQLFKFDFWVVAKGGGRVGKCRHLYSLLGTLRLVPLVGRTPTFPSFSVFSKMGQVFQPSPV